MHYLSKEVFDEIFLKAKKGDRKSKEIYLNSIEGLIVKNIKKYYPDFKNFDDLVQDGNLYALVLLERYDLEKGSPPLAFISNYIRYFYLDKNKKKREMTILDQSPKSGDDDTMTMKDMLRDEEMTPEELILSEDMAYRLLDAVDSLDDFHRDLIYRYFFEKQDSKDIAVHFHISKRQFYYEKQKALDELKGGVDHDLLAYVGKLQGFKRIGR